MQSKVNNWEIGTGGWFNTIMGNILRVGEHLATHGNTGASHETLIEWGKYQQEQIQEILEWYEKEGRWSKESAIAQLEYALKKLKEK